ncbi:EpsG family protein [Flavobacteriaceae bacterium W22]|nr:EpsG family protein [Flavobacteriaceae bacterium W22]
MFDLIPIDLYSNVYNYILLGILLLVTLYSLKFRLKNAVNIFNVNILLVFLFVFTLFYIGFRPIHGKFLDMTTYNYEFEYYKNGGSTDKVKSDYFFWYLTYFSSKVINAHQYFFLLACLYVIPLFVVSKILFKKYAFYSFFFFIASFSFWAYGTNGIRNGVATSIFLLVFATNKKWLRILIVFISIQFHSSMIIPTIALIIAILYQKPKYLLYFWFTCIPVSLFLGETLQILFAGLIEDDRTSYLTAGNINNDNFSSTGFRWDFVLYSFSAVYAGYFYIFQKKFNDNIYRIIYSTYVISNALWILVIKANFSNRFAYLSWFLMALVIIYPLLKRQLFNNPYRAIVYVMLAYFGFTFFMTVIKFN